MQDKSFNQILNNQRIKSNKAPFLTFNDHTNYANWDFIQNIIMISTFGVRGVFFYAIIFFISCDTVYDAILFGRSKNSMAYTRLRFLLKIIRLSKQVKDQIKR